MTTRCRGYRVPRVSLHSIYLFPAATTLSRVSILRGSSFQLKSLFLGRPRASATSVYPSLALFFLTSIVSYAPPRATCSFSALRFLTSPPRDFFAIRPRFNRTPFSRHPRQSIRYWNKCSSLYSPNSAFSSTHFILSILVSGWYPFKFSKWTYYFLQFLFVIHFMFFKKMTLFEF